MRRILFPLFLLLIPTLFPSSLFAARTVTPKERAIVYFKPYDGNWSPIGAYVGSVGSSYLDKLEPDALKIPHTLFHHLHPSDNAVHGGFFPYTKFKFYEAEEITAGRDPLMVTATYQGKKRPVVFYLKASSDPRYAVNVGDTRYVDFYANEYVKKIVYPGETTLDSTQWVGSDNGILGLKYYGVIDDNGKYVSNVKWDEPFPQNDEEYYTMIRNFFVKMAERHPDVKIMLNRGGIDMDYFEYVWGVIPGSMHERSFDKSQTTTYHRDKWYKYFKHWELMRRQNKPVIYYVNNIDPQDTEKIETYYISYLINRGDNFFYAPKKTRHDASDNWEIPPNNFLYISDATGWPVAEPESIQESGESSGYRLYSRKMERGMIYLNQTGVTKTITLPTDRTYYSPDGERVAKLTIPDMSGQYIISDQSASRLPGDANGDSVVDGADFMIWKSHYNLSTSAGPSAGDFNSDQVVDGTDFIIWKNNYTS